MQNFSVQIDEIYLSVEICKKFLKVCADFLQENKLVRQKIFWRRFL